jgi:hypothetical protein
MADAEKFAWSFLIHLGTNMWEDVPRPPAPPNGWPEYLKGEMLERAKLNRKLSGAKDFLNCDEATWRRTVDEVAAQGLNQLVVDIGEGVVYPSHPELAVKGSWSVGKLRRELARLRAAGIEPVPKLNFSTCHDCWLGEYGRMVSTAEYYRVAADLIRDVCEIFDRPRLFHIGFDEEDFAHQKFYGYAAVRQGELWWHDLLYIVKEVERNGSRAWMWADKIWHDHEGFVLRMPKSVLMSNWYYLLDFDPPKTSALYPMVHAYEWLERAGFDQVPTSSSCTRYSTDSRSAAATAEYAKKNIAPGRLKGILQTSWAYTLPREEKVIIESIRQLGAVKRSWQEAVFA